METRGLRIVRYRGRYWCFYNHWDSYLEGMGSSLVKSIPTDPEEYKQWFQAMPLAIKEDHLNNLESDKLMVGFLAEAFDARLESFPTRNLGDLGGWIEYTYTIDLDLEVFSIDSSAHFRLQHIPIDWISTLGQDGKGHRFVHPRLAPEESLASLAIANDTLSSENMEYWDSLTKREVIAKCDCVDPSTHLRLKFFEIFEDSQISSLQLTLNTWTADDILFRELAYFILSLAAGQEYVTIVNERRILKPLWMRGISLPLYCTVVHGDNPEGKREFIRSVGTGFHVGNENGGSAPATSKYWFKGALVCLVPQLDQEDIMKKALSDAVQYGRENCKQTSFNAVLISIADLVLLRSFPDGSIEHTTVMKLLSTVGSSGKDACHRYGFDWLDDYYKKQRAAADNAGDKAEGSQGLPSDIENTMQQDQEPSNRGDDSTDTEKTDSSLRSQKQEDNIDCGEETQRLGDEGDENHEDNDGETGPVNPIGLERWATGDTFLSLISFLNSSSLKSLKPTTDGKQKLPIEITEMILGHIWDVETYNACAKTSRAFRSHCARRPLLMTGLRLLKTLPILPKSEDGFILDNRLQFLAERCNGEYLTINVGKAGYWSGLTNYFRVLAGEEYNRGYFCLNTGIAIDNLDAFDPFDYNLQRLGSTHRPRRESSVEENVWDRALERSDIIKDGDIAELGRYWECVTALLYPEHASGLSQSVIQEPNCDDWLMPANTKQYSIEPAFFRHKKYERFLLLRMKRASRYHDCLWDDIIAEIKEYAAKVDDNMYLQKRKKKQLVGAADPQVILVVGLEVRLFDREADKATLTEKNPDRVYSITDDSDRKTIETVLDLAMDRLRAAEKKETPGYDTESDE
ncbi:MAG: hypothetical protein Q9170_003783 [Blastenia crenularia]